MKTGGPFVVRSGVVYTENLVAIAVLGIAGALLAVAGFRFRIKGLPRSVEEDQRRRLRVQSFHSIEATCDPAKLFGS